MGLSDLSIQEFFPVLQQVLADTFNIESFLMEPPYLNYERFDRGLRKMIWGDYSTGSPILSLSAESPYQILVLESSLGFYNLAFTLDRRDPPLLGGLMPFRTEAITQSAILRLMNDNQIPPQHLMLMRQFYSSLPVADLTKLVSLLQHTIAAVIPGFANSSVEYVNYREEKHAVHYSEERFNQFSSDYFEELSKRLEDCCKAVVSGDPARALDRMKSLNDFASSFGSKTIPEQHHRLYGMNTFLASRMLETPVHPAHIFEQLQTFELKIAETTSMNELSHLPFDMVRKYSILARNYTYDKYSLLIRNVINYIEQHLSGELTLSVIAEEFGKNPSYLSTTFRKEIGDTLTNYVSRQRIQASLRYFNTTTLSVAEVASAVGIPDFGYFSKLFRRYVGVSPREYKKMLDK